MARIFQTAEASRAEAIAALEAARERSERLGLRVLNSQLAAAGPATGQLLRSATNESMAAIDAYIARSTAAGDQDLLVRAMQAGVVTAVSTTISILYEV
ncbi:MAG: hypothetical protein EXR63_02305 [Dehalococcoidia bacterium]|nr:hypothetical protein [Dehalococcoidia bacterium]